MGKVLIKCIQTPMQKYFYDRSLDSVVMVNDEEYQILKTKEENRMKKLNKNMKKNRNTIESFGCVCGCGCPCSYCAATWLSQHNADASRVVISTDNSVMYYQVIVTST